MPSQNRYRAVLKTANQLVGESKTRQALSLLEENLSATRRDRNARWTLLLAREAGLLAEKLGDLTTAVKYFEIALQANTSDPYIYLYLGDVFDRLGNRSRSQECLQQCYDVAETEGDEEVLGLLMSRGLGPNKSGDA